MLTDLSIPVRCEDGVDADGHNQSDVPSGGQQDADQAREEGAA